MSKVYLYKFKQPGVKGMRAFTATVIAANYQAAFEELSQHVDMADVEIDKEAELNELIIEKGVTLVIHNDLLPF